MGEKKKHKKQNAFFYSALNHTTTAVTLSAPMPTLARSLIAQLTKVAAASSPLARAAPTMIAQFSAVQTSLIPSEQSTKPACLASSLTWLTVGVELKPKGFKSFPPKAREYLFILNVVVQLFMELF
jgi:hypothetical protein